MLSQAELPRRSSAKPGSADLRELSLFPKQQLRVGQKIPVLFRLIVFAVSGGRFVNEGF